jgi:hypothetical protein
VQRGGTAVLAPGRRKAGRLWVDERAGNSRLIASDTGEYSRKTLCCQVNNSTTIYLGDSDFPNWETSSS